MAVIDIGSNSARVVVYERDASGRLHILASSRAALRLVREVDREGRLSEGAVARMLETLSDFRAIAVGAGARRVAAVATAAMRDAANGPLLLRRVESRLGLRVEVIDGRREARYGFLGGVRGLAVDHGLLFDMGGGSLQITRFKDRRPLRSWSLPLGALRLSTAFLAHDPPAEGEVRRLRKHVARVVEGTGIGRLRPGEALVGTGGTVRNLAKIDARARGYPIARVHGYLLPRSHLHEIVGDLASRRLKKRGSVPGLSGERGDSIVGGALAAETLVAAVEASAIHVSGQGVREGIAHSLFGDPLVSAEEARADSIASLTQRFSRWDAEKADRRALVADALRGALMPRSPADLAEALHHAARILDVGRSVDFFGRHEIVAGIVMATELDGFSHRDLALLAAVVRTAGGEDGWLKTLTPLVTKEDRPAVEQAAVLLALADDIVERCAPRSPVTLRCRVKRRSVQVHVPALAGWRRRSLDGRFERTFGRTLVVTAGRAG